MIPRVWYSMIIQSVGLASEQRLQLIQLMEQVGGEGVVSRLTLRQ